MKGEKDGLTIIVHGTLGWREQMLLLDILPFAEDVSMSSEITTLAC